MNKSVVLLSAGLDSTVNLYCALEVSEVLLALTFNYGQRAAKKEIERAQKICAITKTPHKVLDISWFKEFTNTSLLNTKMDVPQGAEVKINDLTQSQQTAKSVWVPNRNGIFLNIAAGFAEGMKADWVIPGFNIEEGATFPDNTQEYLEALNQSFLFSTSHQIKVRCFTTDLNKTQIVEEGKKRNIPFSLIWPCYFDGDVWCGQCESCQRFYRAANNAGLDLTQTL